MSSELNFHWLSGNPGADLGMWSTTPTSCARATGILLTNEKEETADIHGNMDIVENTYAEERSQMDILIVVMASWVFTCVMPMTSVCVAVVQSLSHVQLFETAWSIARQAPLSSTASRSLLKFMSTETVTLSNRLILCCPLLPLLSIFPSIWIFSIVLALCIRWPEHQSFQWIFRVDFL